MIKKLAAVLSIFACACAAGAQTPQGYVQVSPPRKLFSTVTETMRKIYPDPRSEMMMALSLAALGYPNFPGVSDISNIGVCVFENGKVITAAINAASDSPLSRFLENLHDKPVRKNEWIVIPLYMENAGTDISEYIEPSIAKAKSRTLHTLYAQFEAGLAAEIIKTYIDESFESELLNDLHYARISLDITATELIVRARAFAEDGSDLERAMNSFSKRRNVTEARYIPQNASFTLLSSVNTSAKNISVAEKFFQKYFGKKWSPEHMKLAEKSSGTFAIVEGAQSGDLQSLTVASTEMTLEELKDYFAASAEQTDSGEFENSPYLSIKDGGAKYYATVLNGLAVFSDNLGLFAQTLAKIKSEDATAPYPLEKYAKYDADFVFIVNNSTVLNRILHTFDMSLNAEDFAAETVAVGKIGRDSVEVSLRVEISTLRAYADIFRKISELKAQRTWENTSQQ